MVVEASATGSVVIDAKAGGILGTPFAAAAPAIAVALMVYAFGMVSMAHFNPAVTAGFFVTGHVRARQLPLYIAALARCKSLCGRPSRHRGRPWRQRARLYVYPVPLIIGIEVLATALRMSAILVVVYTKGLRGFSGIAIEGRIGLDILFLSFIAGASMNPARSLAPALLSGVVQNLWLYLTATFAGNMAVAAVAREKFAC